jgi:hypothetical protein
MLLQEMDSKGEPISKNCRFGYRRMKMIQKRLPSRSRLVVLKDEMRRKMLKWFGKPSARGRSMQMMELLAGCLNADDDDDRK